MIRQQLTKSNLSFRRFYGAWKPEEDKLLNMAFERHGPAWTIVSFDVYGRTPDECRKRHLKQSGTLESSDRLKDPRAFHAVFHDGFDLAKDGAFVRFPREQIEENPITKLTARVPFVKKVGAEWSLEEKLVVREGYEMWGPNWNLIAGKLKKRTPDEVRAMMEVMSAELELHA